MPTDPGNGFETAKRLFLEALDLSPDVRDAFLDEACGSNLELRRSVAKLLDARQAIEDKGTGFLEEPAAGHVLSAAAPVEFTGSRIGRYELVRVLGEGGFGTVWQARQHEPVERDVALKILKRGLDTREVLARFSAERQALALMDHPNIAQIFDGGETAQGLPYFAMELVQGTSITEFCRMEQLGLHERCALMRQVCQAVQHAHTKGVVHRDLKPANILVRRKDGVPEPKVIDFGVAKATSAELTRRTLFTANDQVVGTPGYLAPEQAGATANDVDTRADVYALGAVLYELLTGAPPFDTAAMRERGYLEMLRVIREEVPKKPSTRVSEAKRAVLLPRIEVTNELDWIVMKAMAKDRERRYASVVQLDQDLECFLTQRPVSASPPGFWYIASKYLQRHRVPVLTAVGVLLALVAALTFALFGWQEAVSQSRIATNHLLATESGIHADTAPALALRLALAAGDTAHARSAAYRALVQHRELWRIAGDSVHALLLLDGGQTVVAGNYRGRIMLRQAKDGRLLREVGDHGAELRVLRADPRGSRLLSGGADGVVRVWPLDGQPPTVLRHGDAVTDARFDTTGGRIVSAGGRMVRVWETASGRQVAQFDRHSATVRSIAISPDGVHVISGAEDHSALVWRLADQEVVSRLQMTRDAVAASKLSVAHRRFRVHFLDDARVLTESYSGLRDLRVFEIPSGRRTAEWRSGLRFVRFGGSRRTMHAALGTRVTGVDVATLQVTYEIDGPGWSMNRAAVDADDRLCARDIDGDVVVWDLREKRRIETLLGHVGRIGPEALVIDSKGQRLFSGGADGTLRAWDLQSPVTGAWTATNQASRLMLVKDQLHAVMRCPIQNESQQRCFWVQGARSATTFVGEQRVEAGFAATRDGVIASRARGGPIVVQRVPAGEELARIATTHAGDRLCLSPDGARLADFSGVRGFGVHVYRVHDGRSVVSLGSSEEWHIAAAFAPDGNALATVGGRQRFVRIYQLPSGRRSQEIHLRGGWLLDVAWSPDGERILVLCSDDTLVLLDPKVGRVIQRIRGVEHLRSRVGFLRDSSLAWVLSDQRIDLFRPSDGRRFATLGMPDGAAFRDVALDANPQWLATIDREGRVRRWPRRPLAYGRTRQGRELSDAERRRFTPSPERDR